MKNYLLKLRIIKLALLLSWTVLAVEPIKSEPIDTTLMKVPEDIISDFPNERISVQTLKLELEYNDFVIPGNNGMDIIVKRTRGQRGIPLHSFPGFGLSMPGIETHKLVGHTETDLVDFSCLGKLSYLTVVMEGRELNSIGYSNASDIPVNTVVAFNNRSILKCENNIPVILSQDGRKLVFGEVLDLSAGGNLTFNYYVTEMVDRFGNSISYEYNSVGNTYGKNRLTRIVRNDGAVVNFNYIFEGSDAKNIESIVFNGRTFTYAFDAATNVGSITDPAGRESFFENYSILNKLKSVTDYNGVKVTYDWYPVDPDGSSVSGLLRSKTITGSGIKERLFFYDQPAVFSGNKALAIEFDYLNGKDLVVEYEFDKIPASDLNFTNGSVALTGTLKAKRVFFGKSNISTANTYLDPEFFDLIYSEFTDWDYAMDGEHSCRYRIGTIWDRERSCSYPFRTLKTINMFTDDSLENSYYVEYTGYNEYGALSDYHEYNSFSPSTRYLRKGYNTDVDSWLLNQPTFTKISNNGVNYTTAYEVTYHDATTSGGVYADLNLPYEEKSYDVWFNRYTSYDTAGNLQTLELNQKLQKADGTESNKYRYKTFGNYKRGQPQSITQPARYDDISLLVETNIIDDNGWIISKTDLNGNAIGFGYDSIGRLTSVDVPNDSNNWLDIFTQWSQTTNATTKRTIHNCKLNANKSGCESGTISTIKENQFDSLLRPILVTKTDVQNNVSRYQNKQFNSFNRETFSSYWSTSATETSGVTNTYDHLQRLKTRARTGGGIENTSYLSGNKIQVTDAEANVTTTTYLAYGNPVYNQALTMASPENVTTTQAIDLFGNITSITQTGPDKAGTGTVTQTEYRAYDSQHRLCKVVRNDVGTTVFNNNLLGEIQWQAQGVSGGTNSNCTSTDDPTKKVSFTYDNLGQTSKTDFPDAASPDISYLLDNNGNLKTLTAGTVAHNYNYNSLNLLEDETLTLPSKTLFIDYGYNTQGQRSSLSYPDGDLVTFAPNGFGEPTQASRQARTGREAYTYASGATYYPTGSINTFTYGNGLTHKTTLNNRNLPSSIKDHNTSLTALHYGYTYDNNLNITSLTDNVDSNFSLTNLAYDDLDRLTSTTGNIGIGNSTINYDGLGNITQYNSLNSALDYTYNTTNNRLTSVTGVAGKYSAFAYDDRGNIESNGLNNFTFNRANQMVSSEENSYLYDGNNRRVKQTDSKGTSYSLYSQDGTLLYRETEDGGINYIYLGKKLIAKDGIIPINSGKQHYRPFGASIEGEVDDVGYTGHKFDTDLGLSYMQARYYDPVIGRFYSNDPIGFRDVHSFNRYAYANNNPYKFTDPDGRVAQAAPAGLGIVLLAGCTLSEGCKKALANGIVGIVNVVNDFQSVFSESSEGEQTGEDFLEELKGKSVKDSKSGNTKVRDLDSGLSVDDLYSDFPGEESETTDGSPIKTAEDGTTATKHKSSKDNGRKTLEVRKKGTGKSTKFREPKSRRFSNSSSADKFAGRRK